MPNAVVAATTSIRPARKLSSVSERTPGASPAWYGAAEMPAPSRCADDLLAGRPPAAVDDRRQRAGRAQQLEQDGRLGRVAADPLDGEEQVRAVEAGARRDRVAQLQRADDVPGDAAGGRRRQRDRRRRAQPRADVRQPQVVRPEVVAPLRQAVRLVDRQPADAGSLDRLQEPAAREPLRRDVQQADLAAADAGQRLGDRLAGHARGDHLDAVQAARAERGVLVLHQRDQRRDDQRQLPVDQRRQLVAERFARAGGHDREHVAAGQRGLARLALARPEVGEPEPAAQLVGQIGGRRAHRTIVPEGSGASGAVP